MKVAHKPIPLDQKRELLRMLSDLNSYSHRPSYKEVPMPRHLKALERQVSRWRAVQRRKEQAFTAKWSRAVERVRREIYFGTAQRAITLMERLRP